MINEQNTQKQSNTSTTRKTFSLRDIPLAIILISLIVIYFVFRTTQNEAFGSGYEEVILQHQYYRLLTACFLHGSFYHLWNNCASLAIIGLAYLRSHKIPPFLIIYFVGGILANFASALYHPYILHETNVLSVGASGAIFAVLGGVVISSLFFEKGRDKIGGLLYAIVVLAISYSQKGVDNVAHIAGLLTGIMIELIFTLVITLKKSK